MSKATTPLLGVILAGGQSSRMGIDKATLAIAGTTLLEFMRAKLQAAGIDEIVICRNAAGYLNDDIPQLGPLGALYTLSRRYPGRRAIIIPVDMPLLNTATLQTLQAAASHGDVALTFGRQILPLYLPFTALVNNALRQRVKQRDDLSLAALLRETGAQRLNNFDNNNDDEQFLNANTPQQWQAILSRVNALPNEAH
ncbi:MAG: molybdenum cofactor guanylyltransferase [Gammaproteobacteria bacterium]|nr:molybdenum cofactor guanylyltransferase [Gammaproteobacteria bacterium]MBQ0838326.1 molybdenum cofactor guanylyltransferase [Gammaproteobacteria bacterium]